MQTIYGNYNYRVSDLLNTPNIDELTIIVYIISDLLGINLIYINLK